MRHAFVATLALTLVGCGNELASEGAIKVQVTYHAFHPGCLRVTAVDAADSSKRDAKEVQVPAGSREGNIVVAVYRRDDWSHDLAITAEAMERSCSGPVVATASASRTVKKGISDLGLDLSAPDVDQDDYVATSAGGTDCNDGDNAVYPGAPERCNGLDDNCDSQRDEGLPQLTSYVDMDRDTYGTGMPVRGCSVPEGYATRSGDCDDTRADIHPGATEVCDLVDNDCDGTEDEGFEVGTSCASGSCTGRYLCLADGGRMCSSSMGIVWYPDNDHDGRGASDAGGIISDCRSPGGSWAPNNLDCNDEDPTVYGGATEVCNSKDDDCDMMVDEQFNLGAACQGSGVCPGTVACASDGGTRCSSPPPFTVYPDSDLDTHGAKDAGSMQACSLDAGYSVTSDDCDDRQASVHPGAPELCDGVDNNCNGSNNEGFTLGAICVAYINCGGLTTCAPDGGVECGNLIATPVPWYVDNDNDNDGRPDSGVMACFAPGFSNWASSGTDCDDGDPFTYRGAPEICDRRDNDCNGIADDGMNVCPPGASWKDRPVGTASDDFFTTSSWDAGQAWFAGAQDSLRLKTPDTPDFLNLTPCSPGTRWKSSWVDPTNGRAYLGGDDGGRVATRDPGDGGCTVRMAPNTAGPVAGLVGFKQGSGVVVYGVAEDGWTFRWNGSTSFSPVLVSDTHFNDIHGVAEDTMFAVGVDRTTGQSPRIYRYQTAGGGTWADQNIQALTGNTPVRLNGVWVVSRQLAYAVGGIYPDGTNVDGGVVFKWDGNAWALHSAPAKAPGAAGALRSVNAFGPSSVYVVDTNSVQFFNGESWELLFTEPSALPLWDISGTSPADLWISGNDGRIIHWPD